MPKSMHTVFWLGLSLLVTSLFVIPIFLLPVPSAPVRSPASTSTSNANDIRLTRGNWNDLYGVFSPDGKQIAFASNRTGNFAIWLMNSDGTHVARQTFITGDQVRPRFSSDGNSLAFLSVDTKGNSSDLYVLKLGGPGTPKDVSKGTGYVDSFAWSPDDKTIAYDSFQNGKWSIWISSVSGTERSQLSDNESWNLRYPSWGPNGAWIAFSLQTTRSYKVSTYNIITREFAELTSGAGNDTQISVSPNGQYIAYLSDIGGPPALFTIDSNGSNNYQAVSDPQQQSPGLSWTPEVSSDSSLEWNPESQGILFFSRNPYTIGFSVVNVFAYYSNLTVQGYVSGLGAPNSVNVQNLIGSSIVPAVQGSSAQLFPTWGNNGMQIVYSMMGLHQCNLWLHVLESTTPKSVYG